MRNVAILAAFCALFVTAGARVAPADKAAHVVVIDNLEFSPAIVTMRVGDRVAFFNKDFVEHTATAQNGAFDLATPKGKQASWRAAKAGEFAYFCRLHPNMTGMVRVVP